MGKLYCKKSFTNDYSGIKMPVFIKGKYYSYTIEHKSYVLEAEIFPFVCSDCFIEEYFTSIKDVRTDKLNKLDGYFKKKTND